MGTVSVASLIKKAARIVQDQSNIRWPKEDWLADLNDAQREVVLVKPQASVKNESVTLTVGSTKQTLPALGIVLIDVVRNMGSNGSTPGDAVRLTNREVLDAQIPSWHSDANTAGKIKHFCFDVRDPKSYYVYPKAPATAHYVEIIYSSNPTDCAISVDGQGNLTDVEKIQIDDIYANALLNLMLYRAYSKDAEYAQNAQLAAAYYAAAMNSLGIKTQNEVNADPNLAAKGNPTVLKG